MADRGGSVGSAGIASESEFNMDRRERARQLALERIDLSKDPYFLRTAVGSFECRLCLTKHLTEGSYLAHTQGRRHNENLAKRAARSEGRVGPGDQPKGPTPQQLAQQQAEQAALASVGVHSETAGQPGYRVAKQVDEETGRKGLYFQLEYPDVEPDFPPQHRFMSAYAQRVELPPDPRYQYVLFAAEPYETVAFRIPNRPIILDPSSDAAPYIHWDSDAKTYHLQIQFADQPNNTRSGALHQQQQQQQQRQPAAAAAPAGPDAMVE